ncbi:MAG: hypothetical protein ABJF04_09465 [Reichenbachiella sp.]|uniref:hypothetical protein n=1 Tax=Reichenbachiella sp. TaxID=2184521 RepID=UPI0032638F35
MRKFSLSIVIILASTRLLGQNSFPANGNAEIKSGNLLIETNTWRSSLITLKDTHYSPNQEYQFQLESDGLKIRQDNVVNYNFKSGGDFIVNNGRVGIGTYFPASYLDIHTSEGNSATGVVISQGSDGANRHSGRLFFQNLGELSNSFSILKAADRLSFRANAQAGSSTGTEYMALSNTGYLGIGTTAPSTKLHLNTGAAGDALTFQASQVTARRFTMGISTSAAFFIKDKHADIDRLVISAAGQVGIGTETPTSLLSVAGTMDAREVKVEIGAGAPDYVFADDYNLATLEETASYIKENHHLPEIPSASEIEANGVNLGEMNMLLLKKIEELTLHLIEKDEQFKQQQKINTTLVERIEKLENK